MSVRTLPFGSLTALAVAVLITVSFRVGAQTPAVLGVKLANGNAQLSLAGPLGTSWTIQYATNLTSAVAWFDLTNLTLSSSPVMAMDSTGPAAGRFYRAVELQSQTPTNVVVTNMVWMAPGTFLMGSPPSEEDRQPDETQHPVTLTQGFFIGKYLVTQGDYQAVMGGNPSWFNGVQGGTDYGLDPSRPVESLYWYSAAAYCAQLTLLEQQDGHLPTNWVYRLPTEAEWEYACRAGTTTRFSFGDDLDYTNLPNYAWFDFNSTNVSHAVGLKRPNPAGLYDVHGDVYEWCEDYYGAYPAGPVTNPQGPSSGVNRVFRGGSWAYGGAACRSAGRYQADPSSRFNFLGFRVVVAPQAN